MSYPQRVCNKVNLLIEKFGGNPTRLSDYSNYQRWSQEEALSRDWNTQLKGETYGERVFLKTSKAAVGKNGARIQEFNRYLKSKRGKNVSLDDLAGFIMVFVSLHIRPPRRPPPLPKAVKQPLPISRVSRVIGDGGAEEDQKKTAPIKSGPNQGDFPVVDNWEDL